ncbi:hypothetical protein ACIGKM_04685 [Ectopseudomonas toyotomiensis]|uniref:hypothetical protein n=1 Tax=Ectopseudomonas toyotomiensis TaxID=554344 RepID=UPI0037C7A211
MVKKNDCRTPRGPHGATHQTWTYRPEAVVWIDGQPLKPNLIPFAGEMTRWLGQKISGLPLHTKLSQDIPGEVNNPYSYSLGAISIVIATIINDIVEFVESTDLIDIVDAEVTRIRLESELALYAARFCEASIKQMLYCTHIPAEMYTKASMGQLLARNCEDCRKAGRDGHDISLLGSLAHRFFLCHALDNCAIDHLQLVARRRNQEAAHSESQSIHPRSAKESREHLSNYLKEVGHELGHMADHIGEIEGKMILETEVFIRNYPNPSPLSELSKIPVRDLDQYQQEKPDNV